MKPAIIIAGHTRHRPLLRLLNSVEEANYPDNNIDLIISLDGGATKEVEALADSYHFSKGQKKVVKRTKNIGLKEHILWCGDQSEKFGATIVLEDDLVVDKYYYHYALAALNFYKDEPKMSGIALYSPKYNEFARLPFEAMWNSSSGYFMQTACSWGQAWSAEQWLGFRRWYSKAQKNCIDSVLNLPTVLKNWPESSWKKYFSAYMAENNLYFFYPYVSYTTNCSDPGGCHIPVGTDLHQVQLSSSERRLDQFKFYPLSKEKIFYDSFMEPLSHELFSGIGIAHSQLEIDLYGIKPLSLLNKKNYVLTSRPVRKAIKKFELGFRPIEKSVLNNLDEDYTNYNKKNMIFLAKPNEIINEKQPHYKLANYYSYIPFESKLFLKGYLFAIINRIFDKPLELIKRQLQLKFKR